MRSRRTLAALGLVTAAVALPAAAWFVVGHREADRTAAELAASARTEAMAVASRQAAQLAQRLEQLRALESDRPATQYQTLYHDPRGGTKGMSVVPSPLAEGPQDPLVLAHFQREPDGRVTSPTVNEEMPGANFSADPDGQRRLLDQLRPAAAACRATVPTQKQAQGEVPIGQVVTPQQGYAQQGQAQQQDLTPQQQLAAAEQGAAQSAEPLERPRPPHRTPRQPGPAVPNTVPRNPRYINAAKNRAQVRVQRLPMDSWRQNLDSNEVWDSARNGKDWTPPGDPAPAPPHEIEIRSGPFAWRALDIAGLGTTLAAVRWVAFPNRTVTQGFVIDPAALDQAVHDAALPARVVRTPDGDVAAVPISVLNGTPSGPWFVAVELGDAQAAARTEAGAVHSAFFRNFAIGLGAALLAGLAVVGLVWRTERLAHERAQFAAAAAHELRTPLAGLRMYGEMLAEGLGDPERRGDYARRVATEAERLGRVVSNVLEFTRMERGTLRVQPVVADLGAAVAEAVARQQPALQSAGLALEVELPEAPVVARFDGDAVTQIVHNLLDNAEKYTRETAERRVRVTVAARAGRGVVTVTDNGPGVSSRLQGALFQPFRRSADPDAPAGLGLGLALTQALATAQAGTIAYADAPGGGAAFTLTLPPAS